MAAPRPLDGDQREDAAAAAGAAAAQIWAAAELAILAAVTATITRGLRLNVGGTLRAARRLRALVTAVLTGATTRTLRVVRAAGIDPGAPDPAGGPTISDMIDAVQLRVYRQVEDVYRQAVQDAIEGHRGGMPGTSLSLSRIQAAQAALDTLGARGISGFTDAAGRDWDLVSYVEMATRTAVSRAYDNAQHAALIRGGVDLVLAYSLSPEGSCPLCLPWIGRLLSLTGATTGPVRIITASGVPWGASVTGTLAEAHAAGFRHPNCRCSTLPVTDGADVGLAEFHAEPPERSEATYKASQRQRALERRIRAAKRRFATATTPAGRRAARVRLRDAEEASRAHREQTGLRMTQVGVRRREHPTNAR